MRFLLIPALISVALTAIWVVAVHPYTAEYASGDETAMSGGTIPAIAVILALHGGLTFSTVWGKWTTVEEAVKLKDRDKFNLHRDKRIPFYAKVVLVMFSVFLIAGFCLVNFQHLLTGGFTIFSIVMGVTSFLAMVFDLDNPLSGFWNVQNVPGEWVSDGREDAEGPVS